MEFSLEQRFAMVTSALFGNIGSIAIAVDKKLGAAGRDVLRQVMGEKGAEMGAMMKPMSPGEDFQVCRSVFRSGRETFGIDNEAEVKEDEVVVKVPKCPCGLEGTSRELCEAMMAFDFNAVKTVGPNVAGEIVRTVAVGDPQCELSIKAKK